MKCSGLSYGDSYEIVCQVESSLVCCREVNRCQRVSVSVLVFRCSGVSPGVLRCDESDKVLHGCETGT